MVKGIVRRLDELGRVVIPREYRRIYDIKPGDPMEMYALDNGDIVVRKVNINSQLELTAAMPMKVLADKLGKTVMLADMKEFITGSGTGNLSLIKKAVPGGILRALSDKKELNTTTANDKDDIVIDDCGFDYVAVVPVTYGNEVRGGLCLLSGEPVREDEMALLSTVAKIISETLPKV
ncbi:MAG: AbrB/MazE/SpoVT family DNA-binding domain-containing protein [Clostridia bacterium]|nr:AbrB/MazE/SpoVT family DNA-binding domain-containing protein [Clostridia bacterium]